MSRNKCVHGFKCCLEFCPLEDYSCIGIKCDDLEYKNPKTKTLVFNAMSDKRSEFVAPKMNQVVA